MHRTSSIVRGAATAAAFILAGTALAGLPSGTLSISASGSYKLNAVTNAQTFVANVDIAGMTSNAVGAQFRIVYDATQVVLVSADPGTDFPLEIYENSSVPGVVTMATGVYGGATGVTSGNIAKLTFRPKGGLCPVDEVNGTNFGVGFAASGFSHKISSASGASLPFGTHVQATVSILAAFPILDTPASVSGQACDAGSLLTDVASVSGAAPYAADSCGNTLNVVLSVNGTPGSMPAKFPIGTTNLSWSATDAAGNTHSTSASVQVDNRQRLIIGAGVAGTSAGNSTRAMNLAYSGGPNGGQSANIAMVNNAGTAAGTVEVDVSPAMAAAPACASLKDVLHSLRKTAAGFSVSGTKWTVDFGGLTQGDSNNDDLVDILDFGMYVGDSNGTAAAAARSNFDGDTDVDTGDYTFISSNFFQVGAACGSAWHPAPLASVTVKQLRRMGMGDLAVADINRDGRIDQADIVAFMQGQRGGEATRNAGAGNAAE